MNSLFSNKNRISRER